MSDMQIDLFDATSYNQTVSFTEIKQVIMEFLSNLPGSDKNVTFKKNRTDMAISFFSFSDTSRSLWVKLGKKSNRLEIKPNYCLVIDSLIERRDTLKKLSNGRYILPFADIQELTAYKQIILDIYNYCERKTKGRLFDCCHRYLECSNAKDCTHPDKIFSLSCSYRAKLKQGIIFYGVNRTV